MKLKNVYLLLFGILLLLFLSQCCTSKQQVEDSKLDLKKRNYPPPSLSPGTAEVTATLIKLAKDNSRTMGLFKIDTVHAYGPSTRLIGVGSQLNIEFSDSFFEKNENISPKILEENSKHILLIKYTDAGINMKEIKSWQIINIKSMH